MKFGIMQGRLSPMIGNKIQSFPKKNWHKEFKLVNKIGLKYIEWTIDYKDFYKNPIFKNSGKKRIKKLSKKYNIKIMSLTADCFMQKPFWKIKKNEEFLDDFRNLIKACEYLKIKYVIVPLVDKGSLRNISDEKNLIKICKREKNILIGTEIKILFESDYSPIKLKNFIKKLDKKYFGINYDMGNSAGLNFNCSKEFKAYGKFIKNIHIKDRIKYGTTVRPGFGNCDFTKVFSNIKKINYKGLLIFQTARPKKMQDLKEILINLEYIKNIINDK